MTHVGDDCGDNTTHNHKAQVQAQAKAHAQYSSVSVTNSIKYCSSLNALKTLTDLFF